MATECRSSARNHCRYSSCSCGESPRSRRASQALASASGVVREVVFFRFIARSSWQAKASKKFTAATETFAHLLFNGVFRDPEVLSDCALRKPVHGAQRKYLSASIRQSLNRFSQEFELLL